ncbi:hypothetical protein M2323_002630 [Rhodoblastus acidophilus]|uniref:DUF2971 domain-containing protein n=1 Tax=Rhodoblastus acidophilus TaxID=1074 RepID=UPI00222431DA|nr:DUF2971 domain-containing protein [Rhodoblastus acidophilus]MCW2284743.1 hypothetical protein [Rhodoblastus acidophilus]MCW2333696.1 hypothetical protein [Rhodoblastus acidophilus]
MSDYDFENWVSHELTLIQNGTNIRRPGYYQSLFKYVSLDSEISWNYLESTLHKLELYGSAASHLNDPFEVSPVLFDDLQPGAIAAAVKYNRFSPNFDNENNRSLEEIFSDSRPSRMRAQSFIEDTIKRYRIISFCERADSGLLWSHYANGYQGICLHFLANGFRWKPSYTIGYVSYSKYRPTYPLSLALCLSVNHEGLPVPVNATPLKRAESEKILFFTKSEEWAYEAEVRIVYDYNLAKNMRFERSDLLSIIAGPKLSDENHHRIIAMIKGSPCATVPIRRAKLSKTTFSVEIES